MIYQLDFEMIKKHLIVVEKGTEKLKHNPPQNAKILPFDTKYNESKIDFSRISGDFLRKAINKQGPKEITEELLEGVLSKITNVSELSDSERIKVKTFFEDLYFEDNNLIFVHPKLAFWLKEGGSKKVAQFLVDLLIGEEDKEKIKRIYEKEEKNQLTTKILLDSLSDLKDSNVKPSYICVLPFIKEKFKEDLDFIINNEEVFLSSFNLFIMFYYFIYISQLILKLRQFEKATPNKFEEMYFNLNWEKASKSRESYQKGWKRLKKASMGMFTHSHLLEVLSLNKKNEVTMYWDLKSEDIENDNELRSQLEYIIKWYKGNVDLSYDNYKRVTKEKLNFMEEIKEFYNVIDYQFSNGSRKGADKKFEKYYTTYAEREFCKKRGPLGYTLNLTEDVFFMLVKLAMKDKEKLRMKDVYKEFEGRGVYLDRDSKERVEEFLEKLNLLEKKSDSGDAVYVKSIL